MCLEAHFADYILVYISILNGCLMLSCLRTPVERTRHATTTPYVSQDLQTRDTDVCAILDLRANTVVKVRII